MTTLRNTIVNTAQTCADIPTPDPVASSGMPGDICAVDADCKNNFKCQSKVCRNTAQQAGFACTADTECDLGFWCDTVTTQKCVAVVAPGGACTNTGQPSTMMSQCGYYSYCLNSICVPLYSQKNGYVIPQGVPAVTMPQICASGF